MTVRPAFFESYCKKCGDWIVEGEGVRYDDAYGIVHEDCEEEDDDE